MRWGTIGMCGAWVLIGGPMRWGTSEMGDQWDGGPLGLAENGWTNEKGDQWEGGPKSSNNVVGDLWIGAPMRRGPMRWGTNEMGDQWVGGTNEMGDQWNEWCMGANWGINEMGDQWDGGPMRWGTNEMGDQWDGGPMMCTRSVLPLGNRSINIEMIYKLRVFDISECLIRLIWANFKEASGRALKRIRYVCLTMSLHWFRLWLGAAYTTHCCLRQWGQKKQRCIYASLGLREC